MANRAAPYRARPGITGGLFFRFVRNDFAGSAVDLYFVRRAIEFDGLNRELQVVTLLINIGIQRASTRGFLGEKYGMRQRRRCHPQILRRQTGQQLFQHLVVRVLDAAGFGVDIVLGELLTVRAQDLDLEDRRIAAFEVEFRGRGLAAVGLLGREYGFNESQLGAAQLLRLVLCALRSLRQG